MSTSRARQLRAAMTPHEVRLWAHLRTLRAQGFHFRRQAPFEGYILDFVCFRSRLVIEVDGGHHADGAQALHDARRDRHLAKAGLRTLRIANNEVDANIDGVMQAILAALHAKS